MSVYFKYLLLCCSLLCCSTVNLSAQNGIGKIKNRAKRKAENRVNNRIDQGIDKGLDKLENLFKRKKRKKNSSTNSEASGNSGNIFVIGQDFDFKPSYAFISDIKMEIIDLDKKGNPKKKKKKQYFHYFFAKDATHLGIRVLANEQSDNEDIVMIVEDENVMTFMDQGDEKIVTSIRIDLEKLAKKQDKYESKGEFKKTGRTRDILGYKTIEYVYEDEEVKIHFWVAPDLKEEALGATAIFANMRQRFKSVPTKAWIDNGFALEIENINKKRREHSIFKAVEVNTPNASSFNTTGYKKMSLGSFGN